MNHYLREEDDKKIRRELKKKINAVYTNDYNELSKILNEIIYDHFKNDEYTQMSQKFFGRDYIDLILTIDREGVFGYNWPQVMVEVKLPFVVTVSSELDKYRNKINEVLNNYFKENPNEIVKRYIDNFFSSRDNHLLVHKGRFQFISEFEGMRSEISQEIINELNERDNKFLKELVSFIPNKDEIKLIHFSKDQKIYKYEQENYRWLLHNLVHKVIENSRVDRSEVDNWFNEKVDGCFSDREKETLGPKGMGCGENHLIKFIYSDGRFKEASNSDERIEFSVRGFDLMNRSNNFIHGMKKPSSYMIEYMNSELEKDGEIVHDYVQKYLEWKNRKDYYESMTNIGLSLETTNDINEDMQLILSYLSNVYAY